MRNLDKLSKRVRVNQRFGITRIEVSLLVDAIILNNPLYVPMRTLWHTKAKDALKQIADEVLNHQSVRSITYRKLSIHNLIGHLAKAEPNILAIGRHHSWLINARTSHSHYLIGTRKPIDLPPSLRNKEKIAMLKSFALRHAGIGSPVRVINLH